MLLKEFCHTERTRCAAWFVGRIITTLHAAENENVILCATADTDILVRSKINAQAISDNVKFSMNPFVNICPPTRRHRSGKPTHTHTEYRILDLC